MKVIGRKTSSMETGLRLGPMVLAIMANTCKERNTAKVNSRGLMVALIMASLLRITYRVKESIIGPMVDNTMVNGSITRWKAMECSLGLTVDAMKAPTSTTRKKEMAISTGPMAANMRVAGRMESSMVLVLIRPRVVRLSRASGLMVRDFTGFLIPRVSSDDDSNQFLNSV